MTARINTRFATPEDIADILGVSPKRVHELTEHIHGNNEGSHSVDASKNSTLHFPKTSKSSKKGKASRRTRKRGQKSKTAQ
jgi:hypothetical protein